MPIGSTNYSSGMRKSNSGKRKTSKVKGPKLVKAGKGGRKRSLKRR